MPKSLGELIGPVAERLDLGDARSLARIYARWRDIVGPEVAARAQPSSLRSGVLRVRSDSPAWATELGYLGPDLVTRINDALGAQAVAELRIWIGPAGEPGAGERARKSHNERGSECPKDPMQALAHARAAQRKRPPSGVGKRENPQVDGRIG